MLKFLMANCPVKPRVCKAANSATKMRDIFENTFERFGVNSCIHANNITIRRVRK